MNILNIISGRVPCNPCLADIEARLRSLEEKGLPLPDVEEFIESLDFIDKKELNKALSEYDFTSLIESMSLVNQEQLDNALASYVESALEPYALKTSLEGFATWTSLNTEVERLDSKIDSLDFTDFATKSELNDAVEGIDLTGFATKQELNDAVDAIDLSGLATKSELNERATKQEVNTEVQRLDARIDNIDLTGFATKQELNDAVDAIDLTGFATKSELNDAVDAIDLTGFASTQELNTEIARLEAEIEALRRNPSGLPEHAHEMKLSDFGDIVLVYGERYFAVTPSEYDTERFPLEDYVPIGFVAYPVRWAKSGGLSTRVLAFNDVSRGLWFRGTNDAFVFPELTDFWTGTAIDDSMAGLEKMNYIVSEVMDPKYLTATPSNEASADNFPAFAAAWQYNPTGERFSSTNWYIPSYGEVEQVNGNNETLCAILYDFIDKTGDAVIHGKIEAFARFLMTSSIKEKPEHSGSGYDGWYGIIDSATNPVTDSHAFTAASQMRPMIRLI